MTLCHKWQKNVFFTRKVLKYKEARTLGVYTVPIIYQHLNENNLICKTCLKPRFIILIEFISCSQYQYLHFKLVVNLSSFFGYFLCCRTESYVVYKTLRCDGSSFPGFHGNTGVSVRTTGCLYEGTFIDSVASFRLHLNLQ